MVWVTMPQMRSTLMFMAQMASNWRETGAIAPSGPSLSRMMARSVGPLEPGEVIVELGPGTGAVSRELLRQYPRNPLVTVEFNPVFVRRLRRTLPQLTVIEGCASQLPVYLQALAIPRARIGAVVSGLPLLVFPKDLSASIFNAIATILPEGRAYVQFTYSKRAWRRFEPSGFHAHAPRKVWFNLPPAVVLPFTRAG